MATTGDTMAATGESSGGVPPCVLVLGSTFHNAVGGVVIRLCFLLFRLTTDVTNECHRLGYLMKQKLGIN